MKLLKKLNRFVNTHISDKEKIRNQMPILVSREDYQKELDKYFEDGLIDGAFEMAYWLTLLFKEVTKFEVRGKDKSLEDKLGLAYNFCDKYDFLYTDMIKSRVNSERYLGESALNRIENTEYVSSNGEYKTIPKLYEECKKIVEECKKMAEEEKENENQEKE